MAFEQDIQTTERKTFSFGFYFAMALIGLAVDQGTKLLVADPFRNYEFAFSLPVPQPLMFLIYAAVFAVVIFYLYKKFWELLHWQKIAWSLIVAGAVSNIGERVALGYVRDFIPLLGGILNIADLLILGGIAILLYHDFFPGLQERLKKN